MFEITSSVPEFDFGDEHEDGLPKQYQGTLHGLIVENGEIFAQVTINNLPIPCKGLLKYDKLTEKYNEYLLHCRLYNSLDTSRSHEESALLMLMIDLMGSSEDDKQSQENDNE